MRKKFATNLIFLFAANLLVKPFWIFGIDRVVQNKVGPEVYGTYFAVFNYSFILSIILDFGINNFNTRAVSRNRNRAGEYLLNLFVVKLFLSIIYFAFTFLSATATGYSDIQLQMLFFLAVNQILLSAILYFRSNIAALQLFKTDSLVSILDRLLTIVFCLVLLYAPLFKNEFNILRFIYAQTLALLITALISFILIIRTTTLSKQLWKFKFTKLILLKSMPFALLSLLMGIYYRIDGVMIERMLPNGAKEAGIYAASFRLLDALNMFGYLFATLLLPMFANMIRKRISVNELVKFSAELMFSMATISGALCLFYQGEIMHLLYHESTAYWAKIFGWLMLNFIPMSSIYIFGTLLTANGSLKILNMIALGGMLLNIGLNLFMIPKYGALGATFATLITQLFAALLHIAAAQNEFKLKYSAKDLIRVILFTVFCFSLVWLSTQLSINWLINFGIGLLLCTSTMLAVGFIPLKQALSLLKNKVAS